MKTTRFNAGPAQVTSEMLEVALLKAREAGLLPRHSTAVETAAEAELLRGILQAALDTLQDRAGEAYQECPQREATATPPLTR